MKSFPRRTAEHAFERLLLATDSADVPAWLNAQIGVIASIHGFAVATRDTAPFQSAELSVINPWEGPGESFG